MEYYITSHPPKTQRSLKKREKKGCKRQRWQIIRKLYCRCNRKLHTLSNWNCDKLCANSSQFKCQHMKWGYPWLPTPLQGDTGNWQKLGDRESVFFQNVVVLGKPAISCWKTTHPRLYGQHKLDLINVCVVGRHKVGSVKKEGCSWQSLGHGYNKYE